MTHVAVIRFPGTNCEQETMWAVTRVMRARARLISSDDTALGEADAVILPGGFSWGDYLRSGAMAARAPIMDAVIDAAERGTPVIGICNGFQILCEAGLLPGALVRNDHGRFTCRTTWLDPATTIAAGSWPTARPVAIPVAHADGRYVADTHTLDQLVASGQIVARYAPGDNPNGSALDIAGICNAAGNVIGLMPHPERACDPRLGMTDGRAFFESLAAGLRHRKARAVVA